MSSVTFLASAVLTVCILHAVDKNMENAVSKMGESFQEKAEINQQDRDKFQQLIKPADAHIFTPNAQVFGAKKFENLESSQVSEKQVVAKNNGAI